MKSNNGTFPVLNPNVYLNFLPYGTANQFEVARNIYLATLGALIWDILVSLPEDLVLLKRDPQPIIIAYFLVRTSALGYVLQSVISKTRPVEHCPALELGIGCCWVIATASSSFLFLRHVQALYQDKRLVYYGFFVLYLANVGMSTVVPIGAHAGPLAETGYCVNTGVKYYVAASTFMALAFDSLVFLAVSYQMAAGHGERGEKSTWSVWVTGKALPLLSRVVLQGGQQYYLITVGANILISVLIVAPSVPPMYKAAFTIPDIALTSSMACRVFRHLRLSGDKTDVRISTIRFDRNAPSTLDFGNNVSDATRVGKPADSSGIKISASINSV